MACKGSSSLIGKSPLVSAWVTSEIMISPALAAEQSREAVLTVSIGLILLLVFHMDIAHETANYFLSAFFETVSAFATVGLSMGATGTLNPGGKIVVMILMFVGRVGLLTMAYIVTSRLRPITYRYADGRIMIG